MTGPALLSIVVAILVISEVSAFRTDKCSHEQLDQALSQFEECVEEGISTNICTSFYQLDLCFPRHFSDCLNQTQVQEITQNAKAVLRKALELILEDHQLQYGGFVSGSLFDTCRDIPSHEVAVKADSRNAVPVTTSQHHFNDNI